MNEALNKPKAGGAAAGSSDSDAIVRASSSSSSVSCAKLERKRHSNGQLKKIMQDLYS